MDPTDWLDRLTLYLAPLREHGTVETWEDNKIRAGDQWRLEIDAALERATAAILLVGPGFLASEFITKIELPTLLQSAQRRGTRVYPLIVGYCRYDLSPLKDYQAFNDPTAPLEDRDLPKQNKLLNELSQQVDADLRQKKIAAQPAPEPRVNLRSAVVKIQRHLESNHAAFLAQARRRNDLVAAVEMRLKIKGTIQYEKFLFRHCPAMNEEELFEFNQIRAMTAGVIHDGNQAVLTLLDQNPELLEQIDALTALRQHLAFWLNKYDRVFEKEPRMALLYTGVEDGVPFPKTVDGAVASWLSANS
jgi:hypothetical protein